MPEAQGISQSSEDAQIALLKAASQMPRSRILGVDLTKEEVDQALATPRGSGEGRRADGVYEIIEVGTGNPNGLTGKFRRISDGLLVDAEINYSELTGDEVHLLVQAIPGKSRLALSVNAWFVNDKITRASVLRIDPVRDA